MIYAYLPAELREKPFEDLSFEDFYQYYAMADHIRDMRIEDIHNGMIKAMNDMVNG